MLEFSRVFTTRQQALDVYKSQLSGQMIYVESFESYPNGTPAKLSLEISETAQKIVLDAFVDCGIGKKSAIERGFGQRPGLLLKVPIRPEIIEKLRNFFLAGSKGNTAPVSPNTSKAESCESNSAVRAPVLQARKPFENIQTASEQDAIAEADRFLSNAKHGSLFSLFNLTNAATRNELRSVYNALVRALHPDRYTPAFGDELRQKLTTAYQIINGAYQILQNSVERSIYMDVSREIGRLSGISLDDYRKWQTEYRNKNANNIHMAEELVTRAQTEYKNDENAYNQTLKLALKYDPYCQAARAKLQK